MSAKWNHPKYLKYAKDRGVNFETIQDDEVLGWMFGDWLENEGATASINRSIHYLEKMIKVLGSDVSYTENELREKGMFSNLQNTVDIYGQVLEGRISKWAEIPQDVNLLEHIATLSTSTEDQKTEFTEKLQTLLHSYYSVISDFSQAISDEQESQKQGPLDSESSVLWNTVFMAPSGNSSSDEILLSKQWIEHITGITSHSQDDLLGKARKAPDGSAAALMGAVTFTVDENYGDPNKYRCKIDLGEREIANLIHAGNLKAWDSLNGGGRQWGDKGKKVNYILWKGIFVLEDNPYARGYYNGIKNFVTTDVEEGVMQKIGDSPPPQIIRVNFSVGEKEFFEKYLRNYFNKSRRKVYITEGG